MLEAAAAGCQPAPLVQEYAKNGPSQYHLQHGREMAQSVI
jgi:hypothetical protein